MRPQAVRPAEHVTSGSVRQVHHRHTAVSTRNFKEYWNLSV